MLFTAVAPHCDNIWNYKHIALLIKTSAIAQVNTVLYIERLMHYTIYELLATTGRKR
jgi:hypothetical protein